MTTPVDPAQAADPAAIDMAVGPLADAAGWLLTGIVGIFRLVGLAFETLYWLIGWIWWPIGQVLGFVAGILGDIFRVIGSEIYIWITEPFPGTARYIDLLSFGPGGWGDDLWEGTKLTLHLAVISLGFGLLIGLAGAGAKLAPNKWLNRLGDLYTTVIRGIPELLTLLLIYYGLQFSLQGLLEILQTPAICAAVDLGGKLDSLWLHGANTAICGDGPVEISGFAAGVTALSLVFGAFATEVFRGAILAVPKGQLEAARAIGMSRPLMIRRILLPQVWRFALPGLGNLWLVLIKDTSLISVIAFDELMRKTFIAVGVAKEPFLFFGVACLVYLAITGLSMIVFNKVERWASRGVRRA